MKAPPAFQFYPADFMTGTSRFTAEDVGGYILLLCEQWHTGSVPGDDEQALARILRCGRLKARTIWAHIRHKFQREESGVWLNARMEDERNRQRDFSKNQAGRGKSGADKRWAKGANSGANGGGADSERHIPAIAQASPDDGSSSSVRTEEVPKAVPPPPISTLSGVRPPPLIVGPLRYMQQAEKFAWYGSRLRVPHVLHDELRTKLGGADPHTTLLAWYVTVNDDAEAHGTPIVDVFVFLRPKFVEWASDAAADAELEKFRPKEAAWTGTPGNGSTSGSAPRTARPSTANNAPRTTKV